MNSPKALLIAAGLVFLSISAAANGVDYANSRGTITAGGTLIITGNGKNGVPTGTLYQGMFTSATWTVTALPGGNNVFSFTGSLQGKGSFSGAVVTLQGSKIVHGNPFASGGSDTVGLASGDTTTSTIPEPGSLALMSTGVLGIGAVFRRKLFA